MMTLILAALLPAWEMRVIDATALSHGLDRERKALLVAIRRAENGARKHYGVEDARCVGYDQQCRWAANTIRLRYTGDLEAFAKRWCPYDWYVWSRNVRFFMRIQGVEK